MVDTSTLPGITGNPLEVELPDGRENCWDWVLSGARKGVVDGFGSGPEGRGVPGVCAEEKVWFVKGPTDPNTCADTGVAGCGAWENPGAPADADLGVLKEGIACAVLFPPDSITLPAARRPALKSGAAC